MVGFYIWACPAVQVIWSIHQQKISACSAPRREIIIKRASFEDLRLRRRFAPRNDRLDKHSMPNLGRRKQTNHFTHAYSFSICKNSWQVCKLVHSYRLHKLEACATILYASAFHPRQSVADKKSFHVRIGNGGAPKAQYHPSTKTPCVLCALARA